VKKYECLFIINPDAASARFDQVKNAIRQDIERHHGAIEKAEELGQRVLSYSIKHCTEGFYFLVQFAVEPKAIADLRARYRLNADILRFLLTTAEILLPENPLPENPT